MASFIPYGRQKILEGDLAAVGEVLASDFLTGGKTVEKFERAFAAYVGAKHAVAMNSATSALHIAMRLIGVGPGDRVVTSPNSFVASANCVAFVGATPDFSDIDSISHNLDPKALSAMWSSDIKAVIAVDYAGQPCDINAISKIARNNGAIVVEDASHAVGSELLENGQRWKTGGHPWADITIFSFHPVKIMTTGEGGMLVTDNQVWAEKARSLRSHGIERHKFRGIANDGEAELREEGPWYYEMQELGFNYRLTDIQCALGISQLEHVDDFISRRREIVSQYNDAFADISWLTRPSVISPAFHKGVAWHLYTVEIDYHSIKKTRSEVMKQLRKCDIGTQVLYIPIYLQPWYADSYGYRSGKCPISEAFYKRALSLPLHPSMSGGDVVRVVDAVRMIA